MSHFYKYVPPFDAKLIQSVDSFAKARKRDDEVFKSITTTLSNAPQSGVKTPDGFGNWLEWSMWSLGREGWEFEEAQRRKYKMRKHPETGEEMTSSDFGTAGHDALENYNKGGEEWFENPFSDYVVLWIRWLNKEGIKPVSAELQVGDPTRRIAGMIDFVGKDAGGKLVICDYKFRDKNAKGSLAKTYEKDCIQLAWAAQVVQWRECLDYMPEIYSIVFDSDDPDIYTKKWKAEKQEEALERLDILNDFVTRWERV